MKPRKNPFYIIGTLVFLLGVVSVAAPGQAQQGQMVRIGKKGVIPFDTPVRVGDVLLTPGEYQIQHLVEGSDHYIVFRKMLHKGYDYRTSAQGVSNKEATRVKCRVEPLAETAKHGGIRFGINPAGEKTVEEVHIEGENVKHLF